MTPSKSSRIFDAYSSLLSITTDFQSVETIATQILEDGRLILNQIEALMVLAETQEKVTLNRPSLPPTDLIRMR